MPLSVGFVFGRGVAEYLFYLDNYNREINAFVYYPLSIFL